MHYVPNAKYPILCMMLCSIKLQEAAQSMQNAQHSLLLLKIENPNYQMSDKEHGKYVW